ncbi:unnamed protein product, partial [Ectocarpus sp. 12 AP-2014]
ASTCSTRAGFRLVLLSPSPPQPTLSLQRHFSSNGIRSWPQPLPVPGLDTTYIVLRGANSVAADQLHMCKGQMVDEDGRPPRAAGLVAPPPQFFMTIVS